MNSPVRKKGILWLVQDPGTGRKHSSNELLERRRRRRGQEKTCSALTLATNRSSWLAQRWEAALSGSDCHLLELFSTTCSRKPLQTCQSWSSKFRTTAFPDLQKSSLSSPWKRKQYKKHLTVLPLTFIFFHLIFSTITVVPTFQPCQTACHFFLSRNSFLQSLTTANALVILYCQVQLSPDTAYPGFPCCTHSPALC